MKRVLKHEGSAYAARCKQCGPRSQIVHGGQGGVDGDGKPQLQAWGAAKLAHVSRHGVCIRGTGMALKAKLDTSLIVMRQEKTRAHRKQTSWQL